MDGVIGLIVLVVLIVLTYYFASNAIANMSNKKLKSLIITSLIFVVVMLFITCLPMVGGYSYDSFQEVLEVLFDEEMAPMVIITIIGFSATIIYFACGAFSIWSQEKTVKQINECENELLLFQKKIKRKDTIVHFLDLLNKCEADVAMIVNDPRIYEITELTQEIERKKKELLLLKQKIQK